jgi:hypothetical protein
VKVPVLALVVASVLFGGGLFATHTTAHAVPPPGPCVFKTASTRWALQADCVATSTIVVPAGLRLDGQGHTITFASSSGWWGPLVANGGGSATVDSVTLDAAGISGGCNLAGVAFRDTDGEVKFSTIRLPSGPNCYSRGVEVDAPNSPRIRQVDVRNNTISGSTDGGIEVGTNVDTLIIGNVVQGGTRDDQSLGNCITGVGSGLKRIRQNTVSHCGVGVFAYSANASLGSNIVDDADNGVVIIALGDANADNGTITGNLIHARHAGIGVAAVEGTGHVNNTRVMANVVYALGGAEDTIGIGAVSFSGAPVDGTQVTNNVIHGTWDNPLLTTGSTHTVLAANTLAP